jgi:lipid-A-disaccharide synthase
MIEHIAALRPNAEEAQRRRANPPVVLVLPGSRASEIRHLLGTFGAAIAQVAARSGPVELVLPTVPHLVAQVRAGVAGWAVAPRVVVEPDEKWAAFRQARAALAASGTVTLELALAGIPTVAAYRLSIVEWNIARLLRMRSTLPSVILANLVLGENVIPEFLQSDCTPERLAEALLPLFSDTAQRQRQIEAFGRLDTIMAIGSETPSAKAAAVVLDVAQRHSRRDPAAPAPSSASG